MTATDELRCLLDERGVEYYDGTKSTLWLKDEHGYRASADELASGLMSVHIWCDTPAQAIEATLGRGTCELINAADDLGKGTSSCMCDSCGYTALDDWWDEFKYCPNCGRRIVEVDG